MRSGDDMTRTSAAGPAPRVQRDTRHAEPAHPGTVQRLLALQRAYGNLSVQRLIQCKLSVSQPGDPYEQEADRVADAVTQANEQSGSAVAIDREPDDGLTINRMCSGCSDELKRAASPDDEREKEVDVDAASAGRRRGDGRCGGEGGLG